MIYSKIVWVIFDSNFGVNKKSSILRKEWVKFSFRSKKKSIIKDLKVRYGFFGLEVI